jgi:hypothetical protein
VLIIITLNNRPVLFIRFQVPADLPDYRKKSSADFSPGDWRVFCSRDIFTCPAGSVMETEHGPGMFLFIGALTVTGTLSTGGTVHSVLLHAVTVLFLGTCPLLSGLVHTILSILQALPLTGCCTCTLSPESCCHYGCRDEDKCDNRTDQDSFIHDFFLLVVAGRQITLDLPSAGPASNVIPW